MSPSCLVNRSSSPSESSSLASSAIRCTSCRLSEDKLWIITNNKQRITSGLLLPPAIRFCYSLFVIRYFYEVCFVQQPARAGKSAGGHLGAKRRDGRGAVVANRQVIQHQRLHIRAPANLDRLFGGGVNGLAAIGFIEKRRVMDQQVGTGDQRGIDRHRIARVGEHNV